MSWALSSLVHVCTPSSGLGFQPHRMLGSQEGARCTVSFYFLFLEPQCTPSTPSDSAQGTRLPWRPLRRRSGSCGPFLAHPAPSLPVCLLTTVNCEHLKFGMGFVLLPLVVQPSAWSPAWVALIWGILFLLCHFIPASSSPVE